jgi:dihydrofolate synthase/folylpolyglutamate synthase
VPCIVTRQTDEGLAVIEARAARLRAPLHVQGQHWHVSVEGGRLIYQDDDGLLDLPLPNLPGPHQYDNAGAAVAALRLLGHGAGAEAAVTRAEWPARMQRLRAGPLIDAIPDGAIWLDGGHNPAAGQAIADTLRQMHRERVWLICGMLNTKDVAGFMRPLAGLAHGLYAVAIPGEAATLPAEVTAHAATDAGIPAKLAPSVLDAVKAIAASDPDARIVVCGSLYLAGHILREHH